MRNTFHLPARVRAGHLLRRASLLAAVLGGAACNDLDVTDPDNATPESVRDPAAINTLRAGAIGDFQLAYGGSSNIEDGLVQYTGLFADEYQWAETFPTREQIDRRSIDPVNGTLQTLFLNAQRARASAERAASAYAASAPRSVAPYAESLNLAGTMYNLIGEAYCSGVPFSNLTDAGETEFGTPETTQQIFERAVARFDSSLRVLDTVSTNAANLQRNFARVGRARALLNLGRFADARTAVTGVPTNFQYQLVTSENSARQQNGVFVVTAVSRRFSVSANEGINGLPYRADNDPRVAAPRGTGNAATGFDGSTPLFLASKYPGRAAPYVVADGIEARLIEAEADLRAGNAATALATLNALRATTTLPALTDAGSADARVNQLFRERAYWLFLTSHRLGDLRRLVRQYSRNAEQVFPTGTFFKGGAYGGDVNFPVPFAETNNSNFQGCLNRDA